MTFVTASSVARRTSKATSEVSAARAHARSGDPVAIAAYLGLSDRFDRAIARFSERYADQNERDYDAFTGAIRSGRLHAVEAM